MSVHVGAQPHTLTDQEKEGEENRGKGGKYIRKKIVVYRRYIRSRVNTGTYAKDM